MNYKILITITILATALFISSVAVNAATPSPTQTPTPAKNISPTKRPTQIPENSQIEKIKDLVASRVAELKLVDKKGLLGYVKSTSGTQIVITDPNNEEVKIDIDELTKFSSPDKKDFGISDVTRGDLLSLVGLYNKQTGKLLARFVEVASNIPQNIEGVVLSKDTQEFTINVAIDEKNKKVVNIETSTKTTVYEEGESTKSGFSKIQPGERIIIIGFADKTVKDQINASRILHFTDLKLSDELRKAAAQSANNSTETP